MALGPNDLKQIVLPANWDSTTLQNLRLRDGTTIAQVLADINAGLGILNGSLRAGYLTGLFSEQSDPVLEYAMGGAGGFEVHTEYGRADAKRANVRGHMLPLVKYDRLLGWTWDFLREARTVQIETDIAVAMQDAKDLWEQAILQRFFKIEADDIGSAGKSLPFADAAAVDTVWYPPPYNGQTFATSHTHFFRTTDDGAGRLASLSTMAATLAHHGHMAPYDLIIPEADVADWIAVTGFIAKANAGITLGASTAFAQLDETYLGAFATAYGSVYVRTTPRLPTDFSGMFKRYGATDPRNPLRVRTDPVYFDGQVVLKASSQASQNPLEWAELFVAFGAGVADRTNGAATKYAASGNYATPVVT